MTDPTAKGNSPAKFDEISREAIAATVMDTKVSDDIANNTQETKAAQAENTIPLEGDVVMKTIVIREWEAHRSLWLGIVALAFLLSIGLSFSGDGKAPWWMLAIINLANAVDLLALAALFGLLLAWREVRTLAQKLEGEVRETFVKGARSILLRFALPLAFIMLAAGVFLRLLPVLTA